MELIDLEGDRKAKQKAECRSRDKTPGNLDGAVQVMLSDKAADAKPDGKARKLEWRLEDDVGH